MTDPDSLAAVKRAAAAKRRADEAYRASLLAAIAAGISYAELAKTLGTSRQQIRQWLLRNS